MNKLIISLLLIATMTVSGCWFATTAANRPLSMEEKRVYWGTKNQVINFLEGPQARAERWFVESLGN